MNFSSIFPYLGTEVYDQVLDKIYDHAVSFNSAWNGKIFQVYN